MIPTDIPSLNALAARLRTAAAQLSAACAAGLDEHDPVCPRHLRGEAALTIGSAAGLAPIADAAAEALTSYAHAVTGLASERRSLLDEADLLGFALTAERVVPVPSPRAVGDARAEAARDADLARLNRRRLALHERQARAQEQLRGVLAPHTAEAVALAERLR